MPADDGLVLNLFSAEEASHLVSLHERVPDDAAILWSRRPKADSQTARYATFSGENVDFTTITAELNGHGFPPPPGRSRWELRDTIEVYGWRW
jgi:hypothetical protein